MLDSQLLTFGLACTVLLQNALKRSTGKVLRVIPFHLRKFPMEYNAMLYEQAIYRTKLYIKISAEITFDPIIPYTELNAQ
jgi:hypothetical protein